MNFHVKLQFPIQHTVFYSYSFQNDSKNDESVTDTDFIIWRWRMFYICNRIYDIIFFIFCTWATNTCSTCQNCCTFDSSKMKHYTAVLYYHGIVYQKSVIIFFTFGVSRSFLTSLYGNKPNSVTKHLK